MGLAEGFWGNFSRISEIDNLHLLSDFTEEEVWKVIKELPVNSASGSDGFPSIFFKEFWGCIKTSSWLWLKI